VILKGAKAAGLKKDYIEKLQLMPVYEPPQWLMEARKNRKPLSEYPPLSKEELAKHNLAEDAW